MSISSECSPHQLVQSLSGVTATGSPGIELSESNGGVHHLSKDSSDASSDHTFVLQPWNVPLMKRIFLNEHNFRTESKVDILKATRSGTSWQPDVSDTGILDQLLVSEIFDTIAGPDHTLLAFFVDLEYNEKAEYKRQASISKASLAKLIGHMEIHDAAVQNLLARPDYWSAFARGKDIAGGITASYEFFCQHPRWLQKTRFDKSQHRAPCSVYLHHDNISNTTYYLISSARDEKVAPKILEELNIPSPDKPHTGSSIEALANPFLIHTLVSGYAHLQSVDYLADVRERLFSQIAEVNDYSKEPYSGSPLGSRGNDGREKLQNITKNLHAVSQTCDSGIANADMSIRLCEEMLEAYIAFSTDPKTPPKSWRQVRDSMGWILKTWHCQKNWLVSYKARKDTAMNFVNLSILSFCVGLTE